jgi:hypothetical protein
MVRTDKKRGIPGGKRLLTAAVVVAAVAGSATPALASPTPGSPATASGVQICANVNHNFCLSAHGAGTAVTLTNDERTSWVIEGGSGGYRYIKSTNCLILGSNTFVTTGACSGNAALWEFTSSDHIINKDGNGCYLETVKVSEGSLVICGPLEPGIYWSWVGIQR